MKNTGIALVLVGIFWASIAFNMDVTVPTESVYGVPSRVNNLGLMEDKRNALMGAGVCVIAGVVLIGFGSMPRGSMDSGTAGETRTCPYCAETVLRAASICRFCKNDLKPIRPIGLRAYNVRPDGAAAQGGMLENDIITSCDTKPIFTNRDLSLALEAVQGPVLGMTVLRDDQKVELNVNVNRPIRLGIDGIEVEA